MINYFDKNLIDKFYPGAYMVPAMKVWKLPDNKENKFPEMCANGKYFAELKKDGYWYEYEKTTHGSYLFSRNISKTNGLLTEKSANVPHIIEIFEKSSLPTGTIIIGEIYYPGKSSKDVTGIMGCLAEEAIKRQEKIGYIKYYIHDIICYNNISLINAGAYDRYRILKAICERHNLLNNEYIELANAVTENIEEFSVKALASGEEGVVLKEKNAVYSPDKRPAWSTIKRKKMDFADAICIGFCDATKEYEGKEIANWEYWVSSDSMEIAYKGIDGYKGYLNGELIPVTKGWFYGWKTAIEIGAYNDEGKLVKIGTVSSGLTDELREDFKNNPSKYLNKVVELQCMEKDSKEHTLRHPFFKRFRDDKNEKDCTFKEIF